MTVTTDATDRAAQILSRPVTLNGLTVPNRIVMAPMTRQFSPAASPVRTWPRTTPAAPPRVSA
ncbi:hypothetical protein SAVCW2_40890 [Streptomyces avermitilis]|nr:hypothetical protein SAVCW2_40890 [Streptomyces avermitilis]